MNHTKFTIRSLAFVSLVIAMFSVLAMTLYSAQIVYGETYSEQSKRKQPEMETVEVARGSILDRYGRVLVSNEVSYDAILSLSDLGSGEEREEILTRLLEIGKATGNTIIDSYLPITKEYPYSFTKNTDIFYYVSSLNEEGVPVLSLTYLGTMLVEKLKILKSDPRETSTTSVPSATEVIDLLADKFEITTTDQTLKRELVGVLYELYLRYHGVYWDTYIFAEDVNIEFTVQVKELGLSGISVEATTKRVYGTDYAAHLLGRIGQQSATEWEHYKTIEGYSMNDMVGKEGAELAFESYLRGSSGVRALERNSSGDIMSSTWEVEPVPGGNVVLTLDIDLQKDVEDTLNYYLSSTGNDNIRGAACVMVEVNSGSVLAAGSYPTYNLSTYSEDFADNSTNSLEPLVNRAFQGQYAPGSTFKMVTGIASLEEGITNPYTTIRCAGTYDHYETHGPACWIYNQYRGSHGLQNVSDAITNSCNYYFYDVGRQLGIDTIGDYASMFGLGQSTGIELYEMKGVMAGPEYTESKGGTWYEGATLSVAIGQESSQFTPLQLANYIATLANGGTYYEAHLLSEVKSGDFSEILLKQDQVVEGTALDLQGENLTAVLKGMQNLTISGSVQNEFAELRGMGISVGAKTGTAQLTNVASDTANSVFVCFAPFENPEIAVAVVVERGGATNEAPSIAATVIKEYFTNQVSRDVILQENTLIP